MLKLLLSAAQDFINNLLDECAKCGITEIGENVPKTTWHAGGATTVEETLIHAVETGTRTFGTRPSLILILLPGNGKHQHPILACGCLCLEANGVAGMDSHLTLSTVPALSEC